MSGVGPGAQGQVSAGTTLLWNGANAPVIRLLGTQRSTIEDFFITCPPQTPCSAGVSSETVAAGNPTVNLFHNITMDGVNGTGLGKGFQFIIGAGGCDCNNDANVFDHVGVLNFATAAWSFEHSQSKTHEFRSSYFHYRLASIAIRRDHGPGRRQRKLQVDRRVWRRRAGRLLPG
jgi:hypothetical protein